MGEWNSEEVVGAMLEEEDFKPTIVMVMEDSETISEYSDCLAKAAGSGVRPKFTSIDALSIAKKVQDNPRSRSFPPTSSLLTGEPTDLWAEAIKHSLLSLKSEHRVAQQQAPPQANLTGARSKDDIITGALPPESEVVPLEKKPSKKKGKSKEKGGKKGKKEKKEEKPDSESVPKDKKKEKPPTTTTDEDTTGGDTTGDEKSNKKKKKEKKDKSKGKSSEKIGKKKGKTPKGPATPREKESRVTVLRKRGEAKIPPISVPDDSPKDGPQLYVLLQGFYNVDLIDSLHRIGVKLDGILLLTKDKVEKRNFSVVDIEEKIPGSFQPQNMLPNLAEYLRRFEDINESTSRADEVSRFWKDLASKLNKAEPDSFIHDIALLNCELPRIPENFAISPEAMGFYAVDLLQETAKRIFEMNLLLRWYRSYVEATAVDLVPKVLEPEPLDIYNEFMDRVPAECISLPSLMECLLAQVVQEVEGPAKSSKKSESRGGGPAPPPAAVTSPVPPSEVIEVLRPRKSKSSVVEVPTPPQPTKKNSKSVVEEQQQAEGKSGKSSRSASTQLQEETKNKKLSTGNTSQAALENVSNELAKVMNGNFNFYRSEEEEGEYYHQVPYPFTSGPAHQKIGQYYKPYLSSSFRKEPVLNSCAPNTLTPKFLGPQYIKTHDFASMRTCHLDEDVAAIVAAAQVSGDFSGIRSFIWDRVPEFNPILFAKLKANLTHFMHYMPREEVNVKDMFFVLHLLLAAGIEIQLQKEARTAALKEIEEDCPDSEAHYCCDPQAKRLKSLMSIYEQSRAPTTGLENEQADDSMDLSHSYLALAQDIENARLILAGGLHDKFNIMNSREEMGESDPFGPPLTTKVNPKSGSGTEDSQPISIMSRTSKLSSEQTYKREGKSSQKSLTFSQDLTTSNTSSGPPHSKNLDLIHGAAIATGRILENTVELVESLTAPAPTPEVPVKKCRSRPPPDSSRINFGKDDKNPVVTPAAPTTTAAATTPGGGDSNLSPPPPEPCVVQSAKDLATLQALIDCPALLAISESGALDLSSWIDTYLFCTGLKRAAGEGGVLGPLKDWSHVEELVPVQMVQALSGAAQSYLCMERIYCPFYDTILFIFNNPTPYSLQAESSFMSKLNTLAGIQHFLEYTINDKDVINFVMDTEKRRGLSAVRTLSVNTLMRLIPEDQWMLIPSIKYTLKHREKQRLLWPDPDTEEEEEMTEEEDSEWGTAAKPQPKIRNLNSRAKTRTRAKIELGDGEARPDDDEQNPTSETENEPKKKGKKGDSKGKEGKKKDKSKSKEGAKKSKVKIKEDKTKGSSKEKKGTTDKKGKKDKGKGSKKGKRGEQSGPENTPREGKLPDESETPLPLLSPQRGSATAMSIGGGGKNKDPSGGDDDDLLQVNKTNKQFKVYDLGKRHLITTSDDYHLFPLDGTVISYNVSTIEPDFRMMQLKVCKNGNETIFYPYYIPHSVNLAEESFVLMSSFYTVLANGTRVAFHDKRMEPSGVPTEKKEVPVGSTSEEEPLRKFGVNNIVFMTETDIAMLRSKIRATTARKSRVSIPRESVKEEVPVVVEQVPVEAPPPAAPPETGNKVKETRKTSKAGSADKGGEAPKKKKEKKVKEDTPKKGKKKKGKGSKKEPEVVPEEVIVVPEPEEEEEEEEEPEEIKLLVQALKEVEVENPVGAWAYPSSDETDVEENKLPHNPSNTQFSFGWGQAKQVIEPMVHEFRVTFPSGLFLEVSDVEGPPMSREVHQTYLSKGSASSLVETSRYYTANGSVVRFLTNGIIQTINARGVTTNIREILAQTPGDVPMDDPAEMLSASPVTQVFKGDILMPDGEFWHISKGKRTIRDPLFVFTSGTLPNGEIFRRRQDGMIMIHRSDGCCIMQYPDGTRFTTRIVVAEEPEPEFEDWEFIGLKYMIEHPNYCPVIFNTLSGNVHIRFPQREWARIFADGSIRVNTHDSYKIDVDQFRATLSCPPLARVNTKIPNMTVVKLFHHKEFFNPDCRSGSSGRPSAAPPPPPPPPKPEEWEGEDYYGEDGPPYQIRYNLAKRQSFAGDSTKGLMEQNLRRPPQGPLEPSLLSQIRVESDIRTLTLEQEEHSELFAPLTTEKYEEEEEENHNAPCETEEKKEDFEVNSFLLFCDVWTICKSVDSYDNRFALDLFGNLIVDKGDAFESRLCQSTEDIAQGLATTFDLPKKTLSGLLTSTSSKELADKAKRINTISKCSLGICDKLPKTRIFVVKRDLSGYEYLKGSVVNKMIQKAKSNPESIVTSDPLPTRENLSFITIMEPISDCENPHGLWKSQYREPVFRPRYLCSKDLRISRAEDSRWFANILGKAHQRRGQFFLSPRTKYLKDKERAAAALQKEQEEKEEAEARRRAEEEEAQAQAAIALEQEKEALRKLEEEAEAARKAEEEAEEQSKKKKGKKGKEAKSKEKKGKKDAKVKEKKGKEEQVVATTEETKTPEGKAGKKGKQDKDKKKKGGNKKPPPEIPPEVAEVVEEELEEEAEEEEEVQVFIEPIQEPEPPRHKAPELGKEDPGDYPEYVGDVKGLYGPEPMDAVKVTPYPHSEDGLSRRTLVVRSIVEIPKMDDKLQESLLIASKAYGKSVAHHKQIFDSSALDEDPRSEAEKEQERLIKKELVEENIQYMHLLQQAAGKLLDLTI